MGGTPTLTNPPPLQRHQKDKMGSRQKKSGCHFKVKSSQIRIMFNHVYVRSRWNHRNHVSQLTISWRSNSNFAHPGSPKTKLCRLVGSGILNEWIILKTQPRIVWSTGLPGYILFFCKFPKQNHRPSPTFIPTAAFKAWKIISRRRLREVLGDDALTTGGVLEGGLQ